MRHATNVARLIPRVVELDRPLARRSFWTEGARPGSDDARAATQQIWSAARYIGDAMLVSAKMRVDIAPSQRRVKKLHVQRHEVCAVQRLGQQEAVDRKRVYDVIILR